MSDKQNELLKQIAEKSPDIMNHCYIVGRWVWAGFDTVPSIETLNTLKELKFHWNKSRKVWQHSCGWFAHLHNRKIDPRIKYGIEEVETIQHNNSKGD